MSPKHIPSQPQPTEDTKLTREQQKMKTECEAVIRKFRTGQRENFQALALACHQIVKERLYRPFQTQAEYLKVTFGFSRSHSLRLASMGEVIARLYPAGNKTKLLSTDAHLRPLLNLSSEDQDKVITLVEAWMALAGQTEPTAKLVAAAKIYLYPPLKPKDPTDSSKAKLLGMFEQAVENAKAKMAENPDEKVQAAINELEEAVQTIRRTTVSKTEISWTEMTWNLIHGCTRASAGCDNCYAAKLTATRLADVYPGLASLKIVGGGKTAYHFTGKIQLAPQELSDPLQDMVPKRYFVNSMSDTFHKSVPDAFIEFMFDVMEKAHWHTFQILTKRPERMAAFTQTRYANRIPPTNIWLGTSTENQEAYDNRLPHLLNTKAAVRWLSCEPLIGEIKMPDLSGVDWVVVGGEKSGSAARPMAKAWATGIRDACAKANVPFFFKQWGTFGESGVKAPEFDTPTLDGVVHQEYPKR